MSGASPRDGAAAGGQVIQPAGWPRPRGYANGFLSGGILSVSGQIGWDPVSGTPAGADFADQTRQALANVVTIVRAAGMTPANVVRLTWYVTSRTDYLAARTAVGSAYRDLFAGHFPAMSVVVVAGLVEEWARVEIEATAVGASRA